MRTCVSVVADISTGPASLSTVIRVSSGPGEMEETVPNRPTGVWPAGEGEPAPAVIESIRADKVTRTARLDVLKVFLQSEGTSAPARLCTVVAGSIHGKSL